MATKYTNKSTNKIIFQELSYLLNGVCFSVHNDIGRWAREKTYCDLVEAKLKELNILYKREWAVPDLGDKIDFLIDDKIILEVKAKSRLLKDDYFQTQHYLQLLNKKLGLLVNFRDRYLKPARIVRIDTSARERFV